MTTHPSNKPWSTRSRLTTAPLLKSATRTKLWKRKSLWAWPVIAAILLLIVGVFVGGLVESSVKQTMAEQLQTILDADVEALRIWMDGQQLTAEAFAAADDVRELVVRLIESTDGDRMSSLEILQSQELADLRAELEPWLQFFGYSGFGLVNREGRVVASMVDDIVGRDNVPMQEGLVTSLMEGKTIITRPFKSIFPRETEDGRLVVEIPVMYAAAPVRNDAGDVVAGLGLQINPGENFSRIMSVARSGESGETYAFDEHGLMLSRSRFDDQLKRIGLLPDDEDTDSILNVQIRDPRVDMTRGKQPANRLAERPLTRMAREAVSGEGGVDVDGYRDYRGVPVIGAWTWLPAYGIGVATEVDVEEAYRTLYLLRYVFWGLFTLLAFGALAIFASTVIVARANRAARHATLEARQLGQYTLEEKIGEGGMGVVYRGRHAMLRRPTAIKLLNVDNPDELAIARFEREVQMTSQLNHPNTVAIYDYGRTPEDVFYYAMEFLDGADLSMLVHRTGCLPEGRVIHVLRQICGSLNEAHRAGLIHRDVKPSNVILCECGGLYDVVKLLDFGLVRSIDASQNAQVTQGNVISGTPQYLSPEAVQTPDQLDGRSDLYSVGAVGYFLLTATPIFPSENPIEVCMQQVNSEPATPSERLDRQIAEDLERVIMDCLAKRPGDRPQSAEDLAGRLMACRDATGWTADDARGWWENQPGLKVSEKEVATDTSIPLGATIGIDTKFPAADR